MKKVYFETYGQSAGRVEWLVKRATLQAPSARQAPGKRRTWRALQSALDGWSTHFQRFKRVKSRSHDRENDAVASATVLHVEGVSPPLREVEQITRGRLTGAVESGTLAGAIMMPTAMRRTRKCAQLRHLRTSCTTGGAPPGRKNRTSCRSTHMA